MIETWIHFLPAVPLLALAVATVAKQFRVALRDDGDDGA